METDLMIRAALSPSTYNSDARTIEAVISTGADVDRGAYVERLSLKGVDIAFVKGVPVLDAHRQDSASRVIGVVESARREGESLVAVIRFTEAPDAQPAITRILEGTLKGVSIGYRVSLWTEGKTDSGKRLRTAARWQIFEVSAVPVAADPAASFRSLRMEPENETPEVTPANDAVAYRSQVRAVARAAGLNTEWADQQIDSDADLTAVRAAAFDAIQARAKPIRTQTPSNDNSQEMTRRADALLARATGTTPVEHAREFMSDTLKDHARAALRANGITITGMDDDQLFRAAAHSTSDFPNLLTSTANRALMQTYQASASPVKAMARQRLHRDFRPMTKIRLGGMPSLGKVAENGEIKSVTRDETKETFSLDTYGSIFSLTRQALINDDLGAFGEFATTAGRAAAETEAEIIVSILTGNPVMDDGENLFDTAHGNLAGAGAAISVATLHAARLAMRKQTDLNGKPINAVPKFLLVAPEQETVAEQVLAELNATTVAEQNPFAGRMTLAVDPRLPASAWYLFADPASVPVLEYAYLSSAQGPQIASREGFDILGMEFRVVLDFGAGAVDWRGAYKNAGA
ncbi:prohead protease/major capsid protein fusion protein [Hyphomonas sp.]|uniref:prohead protease/major capsid protein fusion protein n=1 Tax=Hyphomonas sp. TaxID=87 RepID=UPI0025C0D2CC|nr:prohead protease/major capsid protein fusion protein [Hyphomonas sp.]